MVKRTTIKRHQNERWSRPYGLLRYEAVMLVDEDGRVTFEHRGERPPPGTGACMRCRMYTEELGYVCQYRVCFEFYCGRCGRYTFGMGPVDCPCDDFGSGGYGHKTKDEQPRLPVRRKLVE